LKLIIYGENNVKSRKYLLDLVGKYTQSGKEIITINGAKTEISEIRSALESGSLFGNDRLVVVENLLASAKTSQKKIIDYLKKAEFNNDLVLWETKNVDKRSVPGGFELMEFKIDTFLFKFLDSLRPNNTAYSMSLLKELLKTEEPELVFFMMVRLFHSLIIATAPNASELLLTSPWQKTKYLSQAKLFGEDKLIDIHKKLLEIDYEQKTGKNVFELSSRLELFVAEL
jgi:DNA polymerase III delta subunit